MKSTKMGKINFFTTGGTIDKVYNPLIGELGFEDSNIQKILSAANLSEKTEVISLMSVDSLEMTDSQREAIVSACKTCQNEKIIITHGTDTMVITATAIAKLKLKKTIIITGAMVPFSIENSDATFNVANAIAYVKTTEPGVYIVMNGVCFPWNKVRKNKQLGVFESL